MIEKDVLLVYDLGNIFFLSWPVIIVLTILICALPIKDFIADLSVKISIYYLPAYMFGMLGTLIGYYYVQSQNEALALRDLFGESRMERECSSFYNIFKDLLTSGPSCREIKAVEVATEKSHLTEHFSEYGLSSPILIGFFTGVLVGVVMLIWFFSKPKREMDPETKEKIDQYLNQKYGFKDI